MSKKALVKRIVPLDWFRGACALSIMFYHYSYILNSNKEMLINSDTLSKLGVYGVSAFFVLSGLSMAIAYNNKMKQRKSIISFYSRRIFRIVPLFIMACVLTILLDGINTYDIKRVLLNFTCLFGFTDVRSIPMGGWSIGNEMFFYVLTPLVIYLYDKKRLFGNIFLLITLFIGVYFAFFKLDSSIAINEQWITYTHPLNNLFLYSIGVSLFYNFDNLKINQAINFILLFLAGLIFVIYPYINQSDTIAGFNRFIYSGSISLLVFSFYKMEVKSLNFTGKIFEKFGIATYGVYILHPIIIRIISYLSNKIFHLDNTIIIGISCILTIVIALLSYYKLELKISNYGKQLEKKYL